MQRRLPGSLVGPVAVILAALLLLSGPAFAQDIFEAAAKGTLPEVERLVSEGADVSARDLQGKTPLIYASMYDRREVAEFLIGKGADVNAWDVYGNTPLKTSVWRFYRDVADLLISKGADVNAQDNDGTTPLLVVSMFGNREAVAFLISKGAEVNLKTATGMTPLLLSSLNGHIDVVKVLLAHGAEINAAALNGATPFMAASVNGHSEVAELLRSRGADTKLQQLPGQAGVARPFQTEQTSCTSATGLEVQFTGTGQDGEIRAVAPWPSPRFVKGKGAEAGCVLDTLTGLMWAATPGRIERNWPDALIFANGFNLCGHGDWRLPNVSEMESLLNAGLPYLPIWLETQGFTDVVPGAYWTSTTSTTDTGHAWAVSTYSGQVFHDPKILAHYYAWPVRQASHLIGRTGQTASFGAGDDGDLLKREGVVLPAPRFVSAGAGCIKDSLTGLLWIEKPDVKPVDWQQALDYSRDLSLCGFSDWRLPNKRELRSLVNYGEPDEVGRLAARDFPDMEMPGYWASTSTAYRPGDSWFMKASDGTVGTANKGNHWKLVRPVRGGLE